MTITTFAPDIAGDCQHCNKRRVEHIERYGMEFCPTDDFFDASAAQIHQIAQAFLGAAAANAARTGAGQQGQPQALQPGQAAAPRVIHEETSAMLDGRQPSYGKFVDTARISMTLKSVIGAELQRQGKSLQADQLEALHMICTKIARILNGDPNKADSWLDIAGYARLVADNLGGIQR